MRIIRHAWMPTDWAHLLDGESIHAHPEMVDRIVDNLERTIVDKRGRVFVCDRSIALEMCVDATGGKEAP